MNNLIPFDFDGQTVRVSADDRGAAWFNAGDVCAVLEFGNPRQAVDSHVDPEDVQKLDALTDGGMQRLNHINESGLYALIFGSRKPEARRFKRWVTSDVLPTIRRTGSYFAQPAAADMRGVNTAFWLIPTTVRAARSLGLPREAAIVAANRTVASLTGVDAMALLGIEAPTVDALSAPKPEADFLLAWEHGTVVLADGQPPLPFVPCTGRQLYTAYLAWWRREDRACRPAGETQFVGFVGQLPGWIAGRPHQTYRERTGAQFHTRKMVIPATARQPVSQTKSEWLTEGYFTFQAALDAAQPTGDQE